MVLVDIAHGERHVPYRDSKLTFLLQVSYYLSLPRLSGHENV